MTLAPAVSKQNAQIVKNKSYAATQNDKYKNSESHYVSAIQRWQETFSAYPDDLTRTVMSMHLTSALDRFDTEYPNIKTWDDLELAEAVSVKLSDVVIDTTMQRQLNIKWAIDIVSKFKPTLVVPIQVYRAPSTTATNSPAKYVAWDGQHTLIALMLIASHLKQDLDEIKIPVNVFKSSLKKLMRENFVVLNGEGKNPLEPIDIWVQQVYGVRIDKASAKSWVDTERKQTYLEQNDLFVTSAKFNDTTQPGAIANVQEIVNLEVEGVKHLARYLNKIIYANGSDGRAAEGTEIELMAHYFHQCVVGKIDVTDQYIDKLAAVNMMLFDGDFSSNGKFWTKAKSAYENWNTDVTISRFSKHKSHGFPFLVAQMQKSLKLPVPQNNSGSGFWPAASDLF